MQIYEILEKCKTGPQLVFLATKGKEILCCDASSKKAEALLQDYHRDRVVGVYDECVLATWLQTDIEYVNG